MEYQEGDISDQQPSPSKKWDMLDLIGQEGIWQRRIFLIIFFIRIPNAYHILSMTFLAPNIDHWCARPAEAVNLSVEEWRAIAIPPEDPHCSRYEYGNVSDLLQYLNDSSGRRVVPCDAWEYDETFYVSTVVSEWNLVCGRKWLVSLSKSVYVIGMCFSFIVFGYVSDRFGRKPVILESAVIVLISTVISAFSTSFMMFLIGRFFTAVGLASFYHTPLIVLMEIVGSKYRPAYNFGTEFSWCTSFVTLPGIAWILRDWFWIQIAITFPCISFLFLWWLPESPRWLINRGELDKATKILTHAAKVNGRVLSNEDKAHLKEALMKRNAENNHTKMKATALDLMRMSDFRLITLNLVFMWFVIAFVYYGLSYNTNELTGDPFVNFALYGAIEFPAYAISIYIVSSLGRRNPIVACMITGGVACFLCYLLPEDPWWLSMTVLMLGKFCVTMSFGIIYIFTAELFPTVLRNTGFGISNFSARFGSIVAPFMRELGSATHPVIPQLIFGVLGILSGVLALLLPETKNRNIPDTMEDVAEFSSRRKCKKMKQLKGKYITIKISSHNVDAFQNEKKLEGVETPFKEENDY